MKQIDVQAIDAEQMLDQLVRWYQRFIKKDYEPTSTELFFIAKLVRVVEQLKKDLDISI
jgi:hypothetical protein